MKKKVIIVVALLFILFIGLGFFFCIQNPDNKDDTIFVSFTKNYVSVGDELKVKVDGAKKKNCTFTWYVDDEIKEEANTDTYLVEEADLEKFIKVKVKYKDFEKEARLYASRLPVMFITLNGNVGENYEAAMISMQSSEAFKDKAIYEGKADIKLRGNSTLWRDKKPYKLDLDEKSDLLGMGEAKDWVLLAEDIDHTLVRNRLVMYFAQQIGLNYTSHANSVVLFINDSYQGVYTLIEQVRIGENQVDITDYKEIAKKLARKIVIADAVENGIINEAETDNIKSMKQLLTSYDLLAKADIFENQLYQNLSWASEPYEVTYNRKKYTATDYVDIPKLTGGFLLEADFYHSKTAYDSVATAYLQPFYFNSPERAWTNSELKEYAAKYLQTFEYALHSEDFTYHEDETHYMVDSGKFNYVKGWITKESVNSYSDKKRDKMRYDELFDMDSLVNYFLVCEFSRNWDSMKNSVFIYKDVDEKAFIGPVWDYDWAFGNKNMYNINTNFPRGWQTTDYYFSNEQLYQNYNWNRYLIKDTVFVQKLYDKYWEIRPNLLEDIIKDDGLLDNWRDELKEAGEANDRKWSYTYKSYYSGDFDASWGELTGFVEKRIAWFDEQFKDVDTLYESLNSYEQYEWR